MGLWKSITSAVKVLANPLASIGGSALEYKGQSSANKANVDIMQEQQTWQKMMSDTAHQREVKDLRTAGLNPILSATGGKGASSIPVTSARAENKLQGQRKTSIETIRALSEIKLLAAQKEKILAEGSSARSLAEIDKLRAGRAKTLVGRMIDWTSKGLNPLSKVLHGNVNIRN